MSFLTFYKGSAAVQRKNSLNSGYFLGELVLRNLYFQTHLSSLCSN